MKEDVLMVIARKLFFAVSSFFVFQLWGSESLEKKYYYKATVCLSVVENDWKAFKSVCSGERTYSNAIGFLKEGLSQEGIKDFLEKNSKREHYLKLTYNLAGFERVSSSILKRGEWSISYRKDDIKKLRDEDLEFKKIHERNLTRMPFVEFLLCMKALKSPKNRDESFKIPSRFVPPKPILLMIIDFAGSK
jgi:hypothetical protein